MNDYPYSKVSFGVIGMIKRLVDVVRGIELIEGVCNCGLW